MNNEEPIIQSRLEKILKAGHLGVTSECGPPRGSDPQEIRQKGQLIKSHVDAVNVTDNQTAMTKYMKSRVPGMDVPDDIIKRLSGVEKSRQAREGIDICVEHIRELKDVEGIAGFHIMAIEWEEKVPEIVERAGLFPRPQI